MTMRIMTTTAVALVLSLGAFADADARTLRWAAAGDSLTLDPHAQNEGPTHTMSHQIYEPLLQRDMEAQIIPALATEWAPTGDPNVWEFKLREGVTFHNGNPFNADDVVFSLNRAMAETSGMKALLASVEEVTKVDDHTVHIRTVGPNPLLPNNLTNTFMMDEEWADRARRRAAAELRRRRGKLCGPERQRDGRLQARQPRAGFAHLLEANPDYWGRGEFPLEVTELVFTPIQSAATRVAALLSGEVDLILDVPVQDSTVSTRRTA